MLSRIFIDRPIFAWVLAVVVMLAGVGGIMALPIAQYPDVAPPQVTIRATYPGASASTLQNAVTQVIEQTLTGIDGLLYFQSSSSSRGQVTITVTFEKGIDPDIAQVQVQNQVQQSLSRLPQQVQQQGLIVRKSNPDFLLIAAVYDTSDKRSSQDVSDYLVSTLQDPVGRLPGVGDTNVFGSQYAMRIWLDPNRLASYALMPGDVITAITNQNTDVSAGEIGAQPMPKTQYLDATVTAQSRLQTPEQFADIILKTQPSGATVRVRDVGHVELGAEDYSTVSRVNLHPGSGIAVLLAPGADALETAELVKSTIARVSKGFPEGFKVAYANDSTNFIKLSIEEVVKTLIEAVILVVIVMFVFLQSWRATLIPTIAVPVVLLGTFAVFYLAGFSINTLTLFGLVLAIGLLVDDAIVVVENVERLLDENPEMTPRDATIASMDEISVALVAIALVLSAVFLPMAFFGGSTGVIYRQFSLTIVSAMVLSVLVALILSPALTATLLKQKNRDRRDDPVEDGRLGRRFPRVAHGFARARDLFNNGFERTSDRYQRAVRAVVDRSWLFLLIYAGVVALLIALFLRLPTGFLPTEDQGTALVQFQLPPGATLNRTTEVQSKVEHYLAGNERANLATMFSAVGRGAGGAPGGQNTGLAFLALSPYKDRKGHDNSADAITARASAAFHGIRDAQVYALIPPSIRGLGQSNGFTMELQNTGGLSQEAFAAARDQLLAKATTDPVLTGARLTELPDVPTLRVQIDQQKLAALGLTQADVNTTLSTAWGGRYVNDFLDRGRVKRVYVQGDAEYRSKPEDLAKWYIRGASGQVVPFSAIATTGWGQAPVSLSRFNGQPSYEFQGSAAPGKSSGDAMTEIAKLAGNVPGVSVAWSGLSYQERLSSGQAPILYGLSLLVVFLCLAALYESWSIPIAVLLIVPLGLVGAILAVTLRGLINDVYLQIGLLTTMGLAAKNAILMIEFAEQAERGGKGVLDAALEAAKIRLRPILMTSLAFIFGVLPLAISTGAGANSRIAIGTAVIGGMLTATLLAIFYIPLFFVLVRRGVRDGLKAVRSRLGERRAHSAGGDRVMRRLGLVAALTAVAGCSLAPTYVRPDLPVPPSWPAGDPYLRNSETALPSLTYRDIFRDPRLQRLIDIALANNRDLRISVANISAARAQYRIQRAEMFPTVGLASSYGYSGGGSGSSTIVPTTSPGGGTGTDPGTGTGTGTTAGGTGTGTTTGTGTGTTTGTGNGTTTGTGTGTTGGTTTSLSSSHSSFSVQIGVTDFEIDLFGRVRSLSTAALNRYFEQEAAARATRLTLVGDIAGAWLTYASDKSLLAIAEDTAKSAQQSVRLTDLRLRGGIAPRTDLRQAQQVLETANADLASLRTSLAQDVNALQLLVGAPVDPTLLAESIEAAGATLTELPAGLDSRILLRRPDVVQAEYELRAVNAEIGAARAALFPRISLTALAGFASTALSGLFSGGAFTYSVTPGASYSIFQAGAARAGVRYSEAQRDAALATYERAVQTAFREVSDALARRGTVSDQLAANRRFLDAAADTYRLAEARYRGGIDPFLASLDAQRSLYSARQTVVQAELIRATNLITLYRTLGGDTLLDVASTGASPAPSEAVSVRQ